MKIRLARGGSKKRPFYRIVAADSRMPRDGRFIEKLGTYNPLLPKDSEERVKIDLDRVKYWMDQGAQPTDRISRFLEAAGVVEKKEGTTRTRPSRARKLRNVPKKKLPKLPRQRPLQKRRPKKPQPRRRRSNPPTPCRRMYA